MLLGNRERRLPCGSHSRLRSIFSSVSTPLRKLRAMSLSKRGSRYWAKSPKADLAPSAGAQVVRGSVLNIRGMTNEEVRWILTVGHQLLECPAEALEFRQFPLLHLCSFPQPCLIGQ